MPPTPPDGPTVDGGDGWLEPLIGAVASVADDMAPGSPVLDVGYGAGHVARELVRVLPGAHVTAADSVTTLRRSSVITRHQHVPEPEFGAPQDRSLPFEDGAFGGFVSCFGLPRGDEYLAEEVRRVLRPGSPFVLATWDADALGSCAALVAAAVEEASHSGRGSRLRTLPGVTGSTVAPHPVDRAPWRVEGSASFAWEVSVVDRLALLDLLFRWPLDEPLDTLESVVQQKVLRAVVLRFRRFGDGCGGYRLPHVARLTWGRR